MFDKFNDECGVFGIFGHPEAANLTYLGLYALQHRGQEGCGIVSSDGHNLYAWRGMGLVSDVFKDDSVFGRLPGPCAIGHVRYSTAGGNDLKNVQPIMVDYHRGSIAVAHNGNLVNAREIRNDLERSGSIFSTTADTEVIIHLLARSQSDLLPDRLTEALTTVKGAYSAVFLTETRMVAVRDPNGFRPLALGRLNDAYVVASETCAFDLIEAEFIREIEPGEMIVINKQGLTSYKPFPETTATPCIFEFIYFARPDSTIFGKNVYLTRKEHGRQLAGEAPADADLVMPFPDSGTYAALGYSEASGIPFEMGMIRNHYVGRTFIQPTQSMRDFSVRIKLNPVKELLKGKDIIIIEDSIIRGTTAQTRVKTLRELGVGRIHMRVSGPPHRFPCHYGIDFSTKGELIAARMSVEELRDFLGLDSLYYLSLPGLLQATGVEDPEYNFCKACFDGCYPVEFDELLSKDCLERG